MTQRWSITGVVLADEWEPATDRFRLRGPRDDGLTVDLDTYLYLPSRWFETRKIERAPDVFVEGWYTCNTGQWDGELYLSEEAPDVTTAHQMAMTLRPHEKWIYLYRLRTESGKPPRLSHVGGINWGLCYEKWDIV